MKGIANANRISIYARRFPLGRFSFFWHGGEKKWHSTHGSRPPGRMGQSLWIDDDKIWRKRSPSFLGHESIVPRNAPKQRRWKINSTLPSKDKRLKLFFEHLLLLISSLLTDLSQICVMNTEICLARTGRFVVAEKSDLRFAPADLKIMTPRPSIEILSQENILQNFQERAEMLLQQNRVSKFCIDAGFLTTVEVGQYFMTRHTEEFSQFTKSVTCR